MKNNQIIAGMIALLFAILVGYIYYDKFSFTEDMARKTAIKFFNILMTKSHREFEEIYPDLSNGSRIVTPILCDINIITKREDGNYDVHATYSASKIKKYPISIVVSRNNKIISSNGVSYSYYDKSLEYGKKIGCINGDEDDIELEKIIKEKRLRATLESLAEVEVYSINNKIGFNSDLSREWGFIQGEVVVTNETSLDFGYGDVDFQIQFYSSNGTIIDTKELFISQLASNSSASSMVYSSAASAKKYKCIPVIKDFNNLKEKAKDYIIRKTTFGCF